MRTFTPGYWRGVSCLLLVLLVASLPGCIAHMGQNGGGGSQNTTVTIAPTSATVSGANTQQFTATVTGPPVTSVTWAVNGTQGGSSTLGTISSAGVYTAPVSPPTPNTVSVTAVAVANGTTSSPATVTITASQVAVSVSPTSANVNTSATQNFTATVTGTSNVTLGWYVNGVLNGNSTVGSITATSTSTGSTAVYTAPSSVNATTTATITAISQADPSKQASASVTIPGPVTTVTITPASATVPGGNTKQFAATVTGTSNTAVNWFVNGYPGGNSTLGTIDSTGLYTAPVTVPSPNTVSVTAVSANGTSSAPATVTITAPQASITVSPASANVGLGLTQQFTATVSGTQNTAVGWFVDNIQGGNSTFGTIDSTGLYTAPTTVPSNASVTVTAVWQADSAISGSATVTITGVSVSISPSPSVSIATSGTQQFTATVTGTSNTAVTWSVSAYATCPATNLGSISSSGLYTAPPWIPQTSPTGPCSVVIKATSQGNSAYSASVIANVHVTVTINSAPTQIGLGANWQYTATVTGADPSNSQAQSLQWSTYSSQAHAGTFDQTTGFYTAPASSPLPNSATITATSVFEPDQNASVPLTIEAADPLGSVVSYSKLNSCSGSLQGGTCISMDVSCPGVADITAYLKILTPTGTPVGTALFGVGTGGSGLYDDPTSSGYAYGSNVVQDVLNAGFNTVQISFGAPFTSNQPNGWLQGPGGVRRLACRYATIADWVYRNPSIINSGVTASNSAPMCATGNSGGSAAIAYALYEYALGSEFKMIEPTSGPPMARLDQGCSPCSSTTVGTTCSSTNPVQMCYNSGDAAIVDAAYQNAGATTPTVCTDSLNGNPGADSSAMFISDSILSTQANPALSTTTVNPLWGDLDASNAVAQGQTWFQQITPKLSLPPNACLAGVDHEIPNFPPGSSPPASGQQTIAADIISMCH